MSTASAKNFYEIGYSKLLDYQIVAYNKCIEKGKGGVSLKMGFGKTLLSIVVALFQKSMSGNKNPILVISSKSLIASWSSEITKFFTNFPYEIIDTKVSDKWVPNKETLIILTTPEVLTKGYKLGLVDTSFVTSVTIANEEYRNLQTTMTVYARPDRPMRNIGNPTGTRYFYSTEFSAYIIDEAQKFNNITSQRCKALASICSVNRWLLSGTLFDEPKIERILGYYLILDDATFPRSSAEAAVYIKSDKYPGLKENLITSESSNKPTIINKHIIQHVLSPEESIVYQTMRDTLQILKDIASKAKEEGHKKRHREFNAYILVMIGYFRLCIVASTIPLAKISLSMLDFSNRSQLSRIMTTELQNNAVKEDVDITTWLSKKESIKSSRITEVFKTIKKHIDKNDNMILFSCYVMSLDLLDYLLRHDSEMSNLEIVRITSKMSQTKRGEVVAHFNKERVDGDKVKILLLTYELGAEGLNLQSASTMILLDLWWNNGKTSQAIARIARQGQKSESVNVYLYTSNTGIERALLEKQSDKLTIIEELYDGAQKSKINKMKMEDIIKLISAEENNDILADIISNNNANKITQGLRIEKDRETEKDEEKVKTKTKTKTKTKAKEKEIINDGYPEYNEADYE